MCRCGECFGCAAIECVGDNVPHVVVNSDPGDEQPIENRRLGFVIDAGMRYERPCSCDDCKRELVYDNAPCQGCTERCGQCSES